MLQTQSIGFKSTQRKTVAQKKNDNDNNKFANFVQFLLQIPRQIVIIQS